MSERLHIAVLGAGESGVGAALLAKAKGHDVFVSSLNSIGSKKTRTLDEKEISYEEGQHSMEKLLSCSIAIKSPGIPPTAPVVVQLVEAGVEVISEIEWGYRHSKGKVVAITGSNGKTTTALLTYQILKRAGLDVSLAGNIGMSYAGQVAENDTEWYVLEVSSFQLDDIVHFTPHISIVTNITPDHLDRYGNRMEAYAASKMRIGMNQSEEDYFIYNLDDEESLKAMAAAKSNLKGAQIPITLYQHPKQGGYLQEENITIEINQEKMKIEELALQGKHNTYNSMAAGLAAKLLNIRKEVIRDSLADFETIEHRLEPVIEVLGIEFINDSKATNVNSTFYALESMKKPTIWIAGGVDKGNDYSQLLPLVDQHVKAIVCLGKDNDKIIQEFAQSVDMIIETQSMDDAVRMAYSLGEKGDAVLLSPACASFDLFENYEDRGRQFKERVRSL
jgi:UDP-N-acetylmuramoylalanine--D-glutamate ligase